MAYTDLWPCKRCGTSPELIMLGKNIFVRCTTCNSEKINVHAAKIDEAVATWNRANDPHRRSLLARVRGWFRRE